MPTPSPSSDLLNLLHLAKTDPGVPKVVPQTALLVQALTVPVVLESASVWLLLLEGELIVDLPHGDFRVLGRGDSVALSAVRATLTPLELAVLLSQDLRQELR